MNGLKSKLFDILLYPVGWFQRITDRKATLYAGIAFVGAVDLLLPDVAATFHMLFSGKQPADISFNAVAAILMIVLLGAIDVIFVSIPLFDFFKYLKKKEESGMEAAEEKAAYIPHSATAVKVMKVYIMSHFLIIPVTTAVYYLLLRNVGQSSPVWVQNLLLAYFMLVMIWSAAILARGINSLFQFNPIFRRLTFIVVFSWNFLFGMVFDMEILHWLLKIFR